MIRRVKFLDDEMACAKAVMNVVALALQGNPKLNTCKVRQLCEMMLEESYEDQQETCDAPRLNTCVERGE